MLRLPARVIVTSSLMHWYADKIDYNLLVGKNEKKRKCAGTTYLYSLSKFVGIKLVLSATLEPRLNIFLGQRPLREGARPPLR